MDLIHSVDGIVTCHGTIGMEAACVGTPVLTSYPGYYGYAGFTVTSKGRDEYIVALESNWWSGWDTADRARKAKLFAGWYFCLPDWHGQYVFKDDSEQDDIYSGLEDFLADNAEAVALEIKTIQDWYRSGHPYYHTFKNSRSGRFQLALHDESEEVTDNAEPDQRQSEVAAI